MPFRTVATISFMAMVANTTALAGNNCPTDGALSPGELQREWILVGWDKQPGDPPFDFREKLGKYYDWESKDVVLYDDFDPQYRVATTPAAYGEVWAAPFTGLKSAMHRVIDGPRTLFGSELATSTLEFSARLETPEKKVTGIRTRSTLVWRCTDDGWKIVREHNSSRLLTPEQTDEIFATH